MAKYDRLLQAVTKLPQISGGFSVVHLGRPPITAGSLSAAGLSRIAAIASLRSRLGVKRRPYAQAVADEPFKYGKNCFPGRYSFGFPCLYTAHEFDTAVSERLYYLIKHGGVSPTLRPRFVILEAGVSGNFVDLHNLSASYQKPLVKDAFGPCQAIGEQTRSAGADFLVAPSARRSGGKNSPVFERHTLKSLSANTEIVFSSKGGPIIHSVRARTR